MGIIRKISDLKQCILSIHWFESFDSYWRIYPDYCGVFSSRTRTSQSGNESSSNSLVFKTKNILLALNSIIIFENHSNSMVSFWTKETEVFIKVTVPLNIEKVDHMHRSKLSENWMMLIFISYIIGRSNFDQNIRVMRHTY